MVPVAAPPEPKKNESAANRLYRAYAAQCRQRDQLTEFTRADVVALGDLRCEVTQLSLDTVLIPRKRGLGLVAGNLAVVSRAVMKEAAPDAALEDLVRTDICSVPTNGPWATGPAAQAWADADPPLFYIRDIVQVYTGTAFKQYGSYKQLVDTTKCLIRAALIDGEHEMLLVLLGAPDFLDSALKANPNQEWGVEFVRGCEYWERADITLHLPALAGNKNFMVTSCRLRYEYGTLPSRLSGAEKMYSLFGGSYYGNTVFWRVITKFVHVGAAHWPELLSTQSNASRARVIPTEFTPLAWETLGLQDCEVGRTAWCCAAEFLHRRLERLSEHLARAGAPARCVEDEEDDAAAQLDYLAMDFFPARCVTAAVGEEDNTVAQPDVLALAIRLLTESKNIVPLTEAELSEAHKTRWERTCCWWANSV